MPIKVWTRSAVVRLSRFALFRFFFRLYYRGAWLVFSLASRLLFPEMVSMRVHRGYATGEWEPGISDIDAIVGIRRLSPGETVFFVGRWNKFHANMKALFPVLGEIIVTSRQEAEFYRDWGDIRSITPQTPVRPDSVAGGAKTALALWTECLHSHTQLCKIAISNVFMPAPIAERAIRKCVLDIIRHCAAYRRYPPLHPIKSRLETETAVDNSADSVPPELTAILKRVKASGTDAVEVKRLAQFACAHTTNILEQDAAKLANRINRLTVPAPRISRFAPTHGEDAAVGRMYELLQRRLGAFFASAVFDDVFSLFIVLKNIPGCADDLARGISILDNTSVWRGATFVLGHKSMSLMGMCTYGDDPLKMGFPHGTGLNAEPFTYVKSGENLPFSMHHRTFFRTGESGCLAPREPLLAMLYLESLSHFLRTWRSLLDAGAGGPIYAVSRATALWLYFVKKIPQPCFPLQTLLETFKKEKKFAAGSRIFETSLLQGLQPADIGIISALNAETLEAALRVAAEFSAAENCAVLQP